MTWTCPVCNWTVEGAPWNPETPCRACHGDPENDGAGGESHRWLGGDDLLRAVRAGEAIRGAYIEKLEIETDTPASPVDIADSVIGSVSARGAHIRGDLRIERSLVLGSIDLGGSRRGDEGHGGTSVTIDGSLVLSGSRLEAVPHLHSATIGGDLRANGLQCHPPLHLAGLRIDGELDFAGADLAAVSLRDSRVGGGMLLVDSHIKDAFHCAGLTIGGFFDGRGLAVDGELYLGGCRFAQEVDFTGIRVSGPATIDDDHFEAGVELSRGELHSLLEVDSTEFGGCAGLQATEFRGGATFRRATFLRGTDLQEARFHKGLELDRVTCNGAVFLRYARVEKRLVLGRSSFQQRVDLRDLKVEGHTHFEQTEFARAVYLSHSHFDGTLTWNRVKLGEEVRAAHAITEGNVRLIQCEVAGRFDLSHARLHDGITLPRTTIAGDLDLRYAWVDGKCDLRRVASVGGFRLHHLGASGLRVRSDQLRHHLTSEREGDWVTAAAEWQLVQDSFERSKLYNESDDAYLKTRQMQRRAGSRGFGRILRFLEMILVEWGTGYGTRPSQVLVFSTATVLLFSMLYALFPEAIIFEGSELDGIADHGARVLDYAYFSIVTFTTLGYGDMHPSYFGYLKYMVAAEGFIGAFLMALFAGTLARKIIRQ